jgi:hypothetical protein
VISGRTTVYTGISMDMAGSLRRVAGIAAFVGFTALAAQFAVRLPYTPVPVTMQTLFVLLAGIVLGPRDGFYAMIAYIAIGVAGAPVFAGLTFGPVVLFGPTGGYLVAFPAAALLAGVLTRSLGGGQTCGSDRFSRRICHDPPGRHPVPVPSQRSVSDGSACDGGRTVHPR